MTNVTLEVGAGGRKYAVSVQETNSGLLVAGKPKLDTVYEDNALAARDGLTQAVMGAVMNGPYRMRGCADAREEIYESTMKAFQNSVEFVMATIYMAGSRGGFTDRLNRNKHAFLSLDHGNEEDGHCGGRAAAKSQRLGEITEDQHPWYEFARKVNPNGRQNAFEGLGRRRGVAAQYIHTTGQIIQDLYNGGNQYVEPLMAALEEIGAVAAQTIENNLHQTGSHDGRGTDFTAKQNPLFHVLNLTPLTFAQSLHVDSDIAGGGKAYEVKPHFRGTSLQEAMDLYVAEAVLASIGYAWTARAETVTGHDHGFNDTDMQLIMHQFTGEDNTEDLAQMIAALIQEAPFLADLYSRPDMDITIAGIEVLSETGEFTDYAQLVTIDEIVD